MTKRFEKHETLFCVLLIILYLVVNFLCLQHFGITSWVSFVVNTVFSAGLVGIMVLLNRTTYYGLTGVKNPRAYLYFVPLILIISVNLWSGFHINHSAGEILFYMLTMLNIGFIEEIIFRGFLFQMMAKDSPKSAVIISAVTFGMGHIINLFNGADLIPTPMQICYATAIGFLFVIIFLKSKSLVPCIITHSLVNALSVFNTDNTVSLYIAPVFLTVLPIVYGLYLVKTVGEETGA